MHTDDIQIPGYRIERLLGRGGMAVVYLATQESLDRLVALKILHTDNAPAGFAERFISEGKIIAGLNHPYIITIHDIGVIGNLYYISMEYIAGGDLKQLIQQGITLEQSLDIMRKIGHCLQFVHQKGIVHRDIKPANILFGDDMTPLLTDFGIAKKTQSQLELTATGTTLGSPHYLSPEQAQCLAVDGRADLYSLGIMFYEMLVGVKPYQGDSEIGIIFKHLQEPIPQFPSYLQAYQPFLEKLLAKNRDQRFANATEMLSALKTITHQQDLPTLPTITLSKIPGTIPVQTTAHARRRYYVVAGLSATLLLAALGIGFYSQWQPQPQPDSAPSPEFSYETETPPVESTPSPEPVAANEPPPEPVTPPAPAPEIITEPEPTAAPTPEVASNPPTGIEPDPALTPEAAPEVITEVITEPEPITASEPATPTTEAAAVAATATVAALAGWLTQAQDRLADNKLTTPERDSALYYYQQILTQDANHPEALAGIDTIATRYAELAEKRIAQAEYAKAKGFVKRGLAVKADHPRLLQLDQQLKTVKRPVYTQRPAAEKNLLDHPKRWINNVKSLFK